MSKKPANVKLRPQSSMCERDVTKSKTLRKQYSIDESADITIKKCDKKTHNKLRTHADLDAAIKRRASILDSNAPTDAKKVELKIYLTDESVERRCVLCKTNVIDNLNGMCRACATYQKPRATSANPKISLVKTPSLARMSQKYLRSCDFDAEPPALESSAFQRRKNFRANKSFGGSLDTVRLTRVVRGGGKTRGKLRRNVSVDEEAAATGNKVKAVRARRVTAEVETMVQKTSPPPSDLEECETGGEKVAAQKKVEKDRNLNKVKSHADVIKLINSRKTFKSVTFQNSQNTVRSFSARYPIRTFSIDVLLDLAPKTDAADSTTSAVNELIKMDISETLPEKREIINDVPTQVDECPNVIVNRVEVQSVPVNSRPNDVDVEPDKSVESSKKVDESKKVEGDEPIKRFASAKERQCWATYEKMRDKGVSISYETVLKGMLTPTEYRVYSQK